MTSPTEVPGGVILVIRTHDQQSALTTARGAIRGGIDAVEITLTVPGALEVIQLLRAETEVPIGVGTVLESEHIAAAARAGAQFAVAPNTDIAVVQAARQAGMPLVVGALTPTEIQNAHLLGTAGVKVFPAGSLGGPQYIRELAGPLPHVRYVISGGVDVTTAAAYFAAGAHAVCVGRSMFDSADIESGDLDMLAARTREFLSAARATP